MFAHHAQCPNRPSLQTANTNCKAWWWSPDDLDFTTTGSGKPAVNKTAVNVTLCQDNLKRREAICPAAGAGPNLNLPGRP